MRHVTGSGANKNGNLLHAIVPVGRIYSNHLRRVNQLQIYAFIVLCYISTARIQIPTARICISQDYYLFFSFS
jgi:hypothetical protein